MHNLAPSPLWKYSICTSIWGRELKCEDFDSQKFVKLLNDHHNRFSQKNRKFFPRPVWVKQKNHKFLKTCLCSTHMCDLGVGCIKNHKILQDQRYIRKYEKTYCTDIPVHDFILLQGRHLLGTASRFLIYSDAASRALVYVMCWQPLNDVHAGQFHKVIR